MLKFILVLSTVDIWGNARKSLLFTGATYIKLSSKKKKKMRDVNFEAVDIY